MIETTPSGLVKFADLSFSKLDPTQIASLHKAGYRAACQCLHASVTAPDRKGLPAIENLEALLKAGAPVAGYIWIRHRQSFGRVAVVRDWLGKDLWNELAFVAIDVEREPMPQQCVNIEEIGYAIDCVADYGQRPVLYTNAYWWRERGFTKHHVWPSLWISRWPNRYKADRATPESLGEAIEATVPLHTWDKAAAWQYAGDHAVGGVLIDSNVSTPELWAAT